MAAQWLAHVDAGNAPKADRIKCCALSGAVREDARRQALRHEQETALEREKEVQQQLEKMRQERKDPAIGGYPIFVKTPVSPLPVS